MVHYLNTLLCIYIKNIIVQDGLSNLSSLIEKIKDIAPNIDSSQARYELYIVRTQFESLAQGMDELGPKKPNTMNL